jgi:hypothetical protein
MTIRECDGFDDGLIMLIDIDGEPTDNAELAVEAIWCDCGSRFDDTKHDLTWPHTYLKPSPPMTDLRDISDYL